MKKGRHRRYEEARELKRSHDGDFEELIHDFDEQNAESEKPEHAAWAEEFDESESEPVDE